jgi:hypothetical protein
LKKIDEKLSDILDIEPIEVSSESVPVLVTDPIQDDASFARENIRELISKGNDAMDNLLHVAKESEHPRAYEVAANMLKNLAEMNKDLLEIQKRKRDLEPKKNNDVNIDKAVFIGSTEDLIKMIKANK